MLRLTVLRHDISLTGLYCQIIDTHLGRLFSVPYDQLISGLTPITSVVEIDVWLVIHNHVSFDLSSVGELDG